MMLGCLWDVGWLEGGKHTDTFMISLEIVKILVIEVFGGLRVLVMMMMMMAMAMAVVGREVLIPRRRRDAITLEGLMGGIRHGVVEGLFVRDDGGAGVVGLSQGGAGAGHCNVLSL